ncbi:MAG: OmpH family outer membrane protein [Bacteroidales bacterium]
MESIDNKHDKLENQSIKNRFPFIVAGLNIVLLIGLIALYIMFFTMGKTTISGNGKDADKKERIEEKLLSVAYVDSDDLIDNFYLSDVLTTELDAERRRMENEFSRKQRKFQEEVEKFQRDVQTSAISADNAQQKEQELMAAQQELYELNEIYSERLLAKEMEMQTQLTDSISAFLERFNSDKDYDLIFGYARGGGILFANPELDITEEVMEELQKVNEEK